jgi:hypothetical protein
LLKAFRFVLWSNVRGPIIPTVPTTEEIYPLIAVKDFKKVAWRK